MIKKSKWLVFWLILFFASLAVWILRIIYCDSQKTWQLFLVNFSYFSSLGAGLVVWPAIVIASRGTWMKKLRYSATSAVAFLPFTFISLILIFIFAKNWAIWNGKEQILQKWLNIPFMAFRNIAGLVIFIIPAAIFSHGIKSQSRVMSGWIIFIFSIVFSLFGFDLIMPLQKMWVSAMFGGYFFISGLYIAIAGWCLLSIIQGTIENKEQLADFGKLTLTFCLLTTYLMYAQLLVIWYENIPRETSFLVPRMNITQWPKISIVLLIMVYIGPVGLLIWKNLKYSKIYMAFVSFVVLTGMWIERWWLIMPSFGAELNFGFTELISLLLFLSAFGLSLTFGKNLLHKYA